jgi:amidohydrolase
MNKLSARVREIYNILHQLPELGFCEEKTASYLAEQLTIAGYQVATGVGGTGVVGQLIGCSTGPTVALRADMDALAHYIDGEETVIHSCGHDAHCAMVLTVAEAVAQSGIHCGVLKIIFQPAEEQLFGAQAMLAAGVIDDVDILLGIHLRPLAEAKMGQATPALYHGASAILEAVLTGVTAHGARPHLGVNVIDAAAAAVNAVNAIHVNPVIPATVKITKLHAGGASLNAIPDRAELAFDLRAQQNDVMVELIAKTVKAVEAAASTVGATAVVTEKGGVPAAQYDESLIELAAEAIRAVLGSQGLLKPLYTPGGEDFHCFVKAKPTLKTGYVGLGVDLLPGLHHPEMCFTVDGLINGVNIFLYMVDKLLTMENGSPK